MSRRARTVACGWLGGIIPISEATYLNAIFEAAALNLPTGMVKRKISTVGTKSSEAKLLLMARARGLCVSMLGGYYLIHHPGAMIVSLI
jgi:hypothetical protein